jgi:hypothetical protein
LSADRPQGSTWRDRLGRAWDALPGKGRGRVFLLLATVAVAIAVFVVVPGYMAAQPQFFQGNKSVSGAYKAWSTSVHAQASCQSCHVPPSWTSQAIHALRMPGEFYLSVVLPSRRPPDLGTPTNDACQSCHTDLRKVSVSGDLNIPHRAHVAVLKLRCVDCHDSLVHKTNAQGTHKPTMTGCLRCHDGRRAKNSCSACHTEKALPANHRAADWVVIHPQMQAKIDCAKCHGWTPDWCAQCHTTRPRSHTKTWRTDHGSRVKTHRDCEVCHTGSFCVRCHGEVPKLNFDPKVKIAR